MSRSGGELRRDIDAECSRIFKEMHDTITIYPYIDKWYDEHPEYARKNKIMDFGKDLQDYVTKKEIHKKIIEDIKEGIYERYKREN